MTKSLRVRKCAAMPQIDHDPNEPQTDRSVGPWLGVLAFVAVLWIWYLVYIPFHWYSLALGLGTGFVVASWLSDRRMRRSSRYWRIRPHDE
ncbi:hypothetical protein [Metarhizobium album]|nr:hypothetical protein [Rhizobium album]